MKKIIFLLLLTHFAQSFSQQEAPTIDTQSIPSYLTFDVISILDSDVPRYRFGYIKSINERWALGLDVGYGNKIITFNRRRTPENYRLFEIRPEVYYILNPGRKVQQYLSAELFYINHKATLSNRHYDTENGSFDFDKADYFRQKYGIHIKYGLFINFSEHFGFNPYVGFGYRERNNQYTNVVNPTDYDPPTDGLPIDGYKDKEGLNRNASFTIGYKFYYRF